MFEQIDVSNIGTRECEPWRNWIFERHSTVSFYLKSKYKRIQRKSGYVKANRFLHDANEALSYGTASSAAREDEIKTRSEVIAAEMKKACEACEDITEVDSIIADFESKCLEYSVCFPADIKLKDSDDVRREKLVRGFKRISDAGWWFRKLRKESIRHTENFLRSEGFVAEKKAPYVSNWAFHKWVGRQRKNAQMMDGYEAYAEIDGKEVVIDLSEAIEKSVANPVCRVAELTTRAKGFQMVAESMGLAGLFLTLTCPSKYHANSKKYNGATPREANDYLCNVWANIRADWAKKNIRVFGFRVAEPHKDGTPHWHLALQVSHDQKEEAFEIFKRHAFAVDGDEKGAAKNRVDRKEMDSGRGSIYSYILKYITKNLTGEGIDWDHEAEIDGKSAALRVRAWASVWGIRQFQQIGGVSVTVWRELRRQCIDLTGFPDVVDEMCEAADDGNWAEFCELMGGVFVTREAMTLRPMYLENESKQTDYGEDVKRLIGVVLSPLLRCVTPVLVTRCIVWNIREKGFSKEAGTASSRNLDNNCNQLRPPPDVGGSLGCSYG